MVVSRLQHVNIRCSDAVASRNFYVTLMGLKEGPRPPFESQGYWLYAGSEPVVHLVQKPSGETKKGPGTGESSTTWRSRASIWTRCARV